MARLSSGKRINSASDDAAGVAIASRLTAEIRGTDQAIRNALDGQAMIDTAEGGHSEIEAILQRMREIAIQGASDTNNAQDRGNLQAEMNALITEIDRISGVTTWASNSVMAGDGTANSSKTFSLQVGAATGTKNQIDVVVKAVDATTLGVRNTGAATAGNLNMTSPALMAVANNVAASGATNNSGTLAITATDNDAADALKITIDGVAITATGIDRSGALNTASNRQTEATSLATAINANADLNAKGIYASVLADDGTNSLVVVHQGADNMQSAAASMAAVHSIDAAIKTVNTQRSELGAVSNRLSHTVSNMTNISTNLSAARGGIEDADFAVETTQLAKKPNPATSWHCDVGPGQRLEAERAEFAAKLIVSSANALPTP
jgi:flagellin